VLGDSVRRRNPAKPTAKKKKTRPPENGREGFRWKLWIPVMVGAAVLPFLIGYAIAVWLIFPAPEVAGAGIPVPALRGMSEAEGRQALAAAGLGGLEVRRLPHPDMPEGAIIAQAPLAGQQVRADAGIRAAVSSGPPRVIVPDVVGLPAERAQGMLERLGFEVLADEVPEESEVEPGRVLRTQPAPGERVVLPATVRVTLSAGPPPPVDTLGSPTDTLQPPPDTTGSVGRTVR